MNRRIITLIIGIAALAVTVIGLLVVLAVLPSLSQTGDTPQDDASVTTTTAEPQLVMYDKTVDSTGAVVSKPVSEITVENTTGRYRLITREDDTMAVEDYADLLTDSASITAMCEYMAKFPVLKELRFVEDEAAYGFDEPTATMTATYHDGSDITVVIGGVSQGTEGYYARVQGENTLYIIDSTVASYYTRAGKSLIGKTLITAPPINEDDTSSTAQLLRLWLTGTCRDKAVEIAIDTDAKYPGMTYVSSYVMTAPYVRAINPDVFSSIATAMLTLTATDVEAVHPTAEQLAQYGLSDPHSTAAFTLAAVSTASADNGGTISKHYNDREHMILLGDKNEDGYYYALVDGYDIVYLLSEDSVPWAEKTYDELMHSLLFLKAITAVDEITVTESGKATTFALTHYPDKDTVDDRLVVTAGGKTYSTADFRTLYSMMLGIHRVGLKEEGAVASGEPVLELEVVFNDGGEPMSAAFYPMSSSRYLCVMNDGEESAVSISDVSEFITQYGNFLKGEPVLSQY